VIEHAIQPAADLFQRGGPVMWPLLALSVVAGAAILERAWFWARLHRPGRAARNDRLAELLHTADANAVEAATANDHSLYAHAARELARLASARPASPALAVELVERHRPAFQRFNATLTAVITAAPYLGILGTVIGIIDAFDLLGDADNADLPGVAAGIAQALITTAFGLIVALVALFPTMVFRAQADRCLGTLERLAAAAQGAHAAAPPPPKTAENDQKPAQTPPERA
jgi:biopolymer transport protein ExbB